MQRYQYKSVDDIIKISERKGVPFWTVVELAEEEKTSVAREDIRAELKARIQIFRESVSAGLKDLHKTPSGMSGGQAHILEERKALFLGPLPYKALMNAIAVSEANAKMYRVVACPTAGSCGILPGCFVAMEEILHVSEESLVNGLLAAAGVGNVITNNATVAGAVGGCQAECGSASAMAAAGIVAIMGGTAHQIGNAAALALKNVLGLVCDPIAGLVEVPCIKRNGMHAVHTITAAEMSLQDINSVVPIDQVIQAMWEIGKTMPESLRETSDGGLAQTEVGKAIAEKIANL